jgi:ABC-2 type transport system ATP-binding protein
MNIMCGTLKQTEGEVYISGISMRQQPELAKQQIGFLPQQSPLYMDLTVSEYLKYCAELRMIPHKHIRKAMDAALERCGLTHFRDRLIQNLSGGYRQRVGIAQAIIHEPKLVVLDEPTNGLDPNQIAEVRTLIREIAEQRSVIFSSHILSEVQVLCDEITMIEGGRVVFADSMHAFNNYIAPHSIIMEMDNPPVVEELLKLRGVTSAEYSTPRQVRLFFTGDHEIVERLANASLQNGWRLRGIQLEKNPLDEVFKQLSKHSKQ